MNALADTGRVDPNLINCFRGWDNPTDYEGQKFRSVFVHPDDYYGDTGVIENAFERRGITIGQFYSPEGVLNLAPRLRRIGASVMWDIQNTDYILAERLGAPKEEVRRARDAQARALEVTDHAFCRSEIDREYAIDLGANPDAVSIYRGGIDVKSFEFKTRAEMHKKLVFLGHMYYQPNENALDHIVSEILPQLDDDYQLTVIGIAPQKVLEKYADPRIVFKEGVDDLSGELLKHDIALAPLLEGSGTRLKILDYLASGLPVISTTLGAEGLDPEIAQHITVEDTLGAFADHIKDITAHPGDYTERSKKGRAFTERVYDWRNCVKPFVNAYRKHR
jgi:glycosyltransferase involved in cell wall biosynthesis